MKISFSTLGCPDWRWRDIVATAKDLGYDGIELRGIGKELFVPKAKPFTPDRIEQTISDLNNKGLEISCVTSSCYLHREDAVQTIKEGREYIDLAHRLKAPFVRVLGDTEPYPTDPVDDHQVAGLLSELGDYAQSRDVTVLIETNGAYADSRRLLNLIKTVDHPAVAVLWDIHHPYRFMKESVQETYSRLGEYIRHVHVKDSRMEKEKIRYCLLGQGDVPVQEALDLLKRNGYSGYLSLEWVKRWYYDLEEPGIVFEHFINAVKGLLCR